MRCIYDQMTKISLPLLLCLLLSLSVNSAHCDTEGSLHQELADADALKLHNDLTWLRLLHFRVSPKKADYSDIITTDFFIAYDQKKHGKSTRNITPKEELVATLKAFNQPITDTMDNHPICRYPARYYWLNKKLQREERNQQLLQCKRLQAWAKFSSMDSVSLLMVSGYFGNPASTFGHLLVKLNNSQFKASSGNLLDQSINYGAKVPDNEPIPIYIMKGLLGGYVSGFSDKKFYTQDLVYSKHEFRDMWEYELNLSKEQQDFLVLHLWEVMGMKSTYYFLKQNCGYRIAELIELVTGHTLTPDKQPWYLPLSVFQGLEDIEGSRYIKKITYLPSSQRKLYHAFEQLSDQEVLTVNQILSSSKQFSLDLLANYPEKRQSTLLEIMLDYYQYKMTDSEDVDKARYKQNRNKLILYRLKLPAQSEKKEDSHALVDIESPAKGAHPRLFHIGFSENKSKGELFQVGLTAVHFDTLSNSKGSLENSELKVLDLTVNIDHKQGVSIRKLDIINVQKLGLNNTRLRGESNKSWRVSTGFERTDLSCTACSNFYFKAGIGRAFKLSDTFIAYGMFDGKWVNETNQLEVIPSAGLVLTLDDKLKTKLEVGTVIESNSATKDEKLSFEARYSLSNNNTLRLSFEKFRGEEVSVSFYHHW